MRGHRESCRTCKERVVELLTCAFGPIHANHDLNLPSSVGEWATLDHGDRLGRIYEALQKHRGHGQFVNVPKMPRVDYYVPNPGFIVEFDESQHFTEPRGLTLALYPPDLRTGFDRDKWKALCKTLNRHDNSPEYRDEQRAWYDALRDFAPERLGCQPTRRLVARDRLWCELDPDKAADVGAFLGSLKSQ